MLARVRATRRSYSIFLADISDAIIERARLQFRDSTVRSSIRRAGVVCVRAIVVLMRYLCSKAYISWNFVVLGC